MLINLNTLSVSLQHKSLPEITEGNTINEFSSEDQSREKSAVAAALRVQSENLYEISANIVIIFLIDFFVQFQLI